MKDRYTLQKDIDGQWISAPHNGGDVGDLSDIVEELNRLYGQCQAFRLIIEAYEKQIDKLETCD